MATSIQVLKIMKIKEKIEELEKLVNLIETQDIDFEDSIEHYEKVIKQSYDIKTKLNEMKEKVAILESNYSYDNTEHDN